MKRALLFLLTALMFVSCFSMFTFGATTVTYEIEPSVFVSEDIYNIVWKTNVAGVGYVEYVIDGKTYRSYDEEGGIVRTDDAVHTVSVPMDHLDKAGGYTVTTTEVTSHIGRNVTYGNSASLTKTFRGYQGQKEINMWSLSDVHGLGLTSDHNDNFSAVDAATAMLDPNPDLVTLLGDIVTFMAYEYHVDYIFEIASHLTDGGIPVIYSRGNHETRGRFAESLARYLPTPDVDFCFSFDYGPVSFIIMDYGEDKLDSQIEYNGVTDYENFRIDITNWLATMGGYTKDAQYRIAMCHGADGINHFGHNWIELLSSYGTDLQISGHHHSETYKFWYPANYDQESGQWNAAGYSTSHCIDFPIYITGVHNDNGGYKCSNIKFKDGKIDIDAVNPLDTTQVVDKTITAGKNLKDTTITPLEKKPSTESMLEFAGKTQVSSDFSYITKPAVFDTGDNYTVMWAVTEGTSSAGTVFVEKDGVRYRFTDNVSGALAYNSNRVGYPGATEGDKNIHAVSIPKKYLDNASYEVVTRHIIDTSYYTGMIRGSEITTGLIEFDGYDKATDSEIEMLYLSDWDFSRDVAEHGKTLASTADVVVSGGNIMAHVENDTDFAQYIKAMGKITNGKKPIIFVRGENETVGSYAYYLKELFKTTTSDMFNKITFGPISAVVLDTSAVYEDSDPRYNGLAAFELVRQSQLEWLKETDLEGATYKLAFSSAPELYDVFGYDYSKYLNSMGVDLAVFGHSESAQFTEAGTRALNYACAYNAVDDWTLATRLTFKGGNITVEAINMDGDSKLTNVLSVDDNKANAFTDIGANDWYADAVNYVRTQNLMMGTSETTFSPNEKVTRGMAAVVLAQTCNADLTQQYEHPFTDVDKDAYYNNAIGWCYQNGVTAGTSENTHSPEDVLTREQLCTMLVHVYGDKLESADSADFTDFADVADYAKTAVATLAKAGAVDGIGDGTFAPKLEITRAMLAQILYAAQV